jgi:tetraacyldisaccharide 4'-kinase
MKSPSFWYPKNKSAAAAALPRLLLSPIAALYSLGARIRQRMTPPERVSVPVICIGNFTAGGAGKTPVAIALYEQLSELGETPHFLSRGYGGHEVGPTAVDYEHHTATDVGDEPLLLSQHGPAWVSADRVAGAFAAEQAGASVILLDDGFQNPTLHKDMSLLVVDTGAGIGNEAVIPAGPLREPLFRAMARTSAIVALSSDGAVKELPLSVTEEAKARTIPVLRAALKAATSAEQSVKGKRYLAYAGIGRPEKFFSTLQQLGAEICATEVFPDHHLFSEQDAARLLSQATESEATLITTEKDAVRLRALTGPSGKTLCASSETLPVSALFRDRDTLKVLLKTHLDAARASHTYAPPGTRTT